MRRIINFRPILVLFLSIVCGIIFVGDILNANVISAIIISIVFLVIFLLMLIAVVYYSVKKERGVATKLGYTAVNKEVEDFKHKESVNYFITAILMVIGFAVGGLAAAVYSNNFYTKDFGDEVYTISGRVKESHNEGSESKAILEDIRILDKAEEIKYNDNLVVYLDTSELNMDIEIGDQYLFSSRINKLNIFQNEFINSSYVDNNTPYYATIYADSLVVLEGDLKADETFREKASEVLGVYLSEENAGLVYSMIFGDNAQLNEEVQDLFSVTGIAHILAVSGLHIGFLSALLLWLLVKMKTNRTLIIVIISTFLLAYAYLCGWSVSVVRASLMTIIMLITRHFRVKGDVITNLSFAGIIMLMISPLMVFGLGFQLSFMSVFGIVIFSPTVKNFLMKLKFGKTMSNALAVTLAAQIITAPILLQNVYEVSALGFITNLFVLPIFALIFPIMIISVLLGMIWQGLGVALYLINFAFTNIIGVANLVEKINLVIYNDIILPEAYIILLFLLLFCSSSFINTKARTKIIIFTSICLSIVSIGVINSAYVLPSSDRLSSLKTVDNVLLLASEDGGYTMINVGSRGSEEELNQINAFLKENRAMRIDNVVLLDFNRNTINNLVSLREDYDVKNIIITSDFNDSDLLERYELISITKVVEEGSSHKLFEDEMQFIYDEGVGVAFRVQDENKETYFFKDIASTALVSEIVKNDNSKKVTIILEELNANEFDISLDVSAVLYEKVESVENMPSHIQLREIGKDRYERFEL